jgi:zinc protease
MMDELTLADVNAAIRKHLRYDNLRIAVVTGDAASLRATLASDAPTPITYPTPKPNEILEEDREIAKVPFAISAERIGTVPVTEAFER